MKFEVYIFSLHTCGNFWHINFKIGQSLKEVLSDLKACSEVDLE